MSKQRGTGFTLFERRGKWYCRFSGKNKVQIRRSTGIPATKELEEQARLVASQMVLDEFDDFHPSKRVETAITLGDLISNVMQYKELGSADLNNLIQISALLGASFNMRKFSAMDVTTFISVAEKPYEDKTGRIRTRGASTVVRMLAVLSSMINFANISLEYDLPNPIEGRMKALREKAKKQKPKKLKINYRQFQTVLKTARSHTVPYGIYANPEGSSVRPYMPDIFTLLWGTCFRVREITNLTWDRVDFARRVIIFTPDTQKNGTYSEIPITDIAYNTLKEIRAWQKAVEIKTDYVICNKYGVKVDYPKRSFAAIVKKAGFAGLTPHGIRHSAATHLLNAGTDLNLLSKILRHANIETTKIYAEYNVETLAAGMRKLSDI